MPELSVRSTEVDALRLWKYRLPGLHRLGREHAASAKADYRVLQDAEQSSEITRTETRLRRACLGLELLGS